MTRSIQAFKARYNTYYNGHLAYIDGIDAQESGNKDNYTEIVPLYITSNKATVSLGNSDFARSIEKCQKTIKQHSITARPEWKSNKPKTAKDKIWLSQKEYNPFLYKAWFLMGEAQFRRGEYMEAASTFSYIQRLFFSKPDIVAKARLLEARCYSELDWFYDAEDIISRAVRDSFPVKYEPLKSEVLANCQLRQHQYADAIPNLLKAIKKEKRTLQKARLYFLLGQLYHKTGQEQLAFKAYGKVAAKNPPYELEFNARIQQTEVISTGRSKQMIRKLLAMSKNPKNKDYLDQVFYAIGNIYLANNDTLHAIYAYTEGAEKSTRNGIEKGVVLLHLGRLYWDTEDFVKAHKCYSEVLGLLDKDRDDYKEIDERSKILDDLQPFAADIELQDSLQTLARMDSVERMNVIKKIIEYVKKKEREEERKAVDAAVSQTSNNSRTQNATNANRSNLNNTGNRNGGGLWYFYNPTAVAAGKLEFQKKWGKRELADNWRRANKTVLEDLNLDSTADSISVDNDSIAEVVTNEDDTKDAVKKDEEEYANDPHRPEYYLKDIPLTEEQMQASNATLVNALFNAGVIYKDRMENFPLAEKTFMRICSDFPDFEQMDETYYNMFQLYSRIGQNDAAEIYRNKLMSEYPDNEQAKNVADPNFEFKAKYGKQVEDSLYTEAYNAFVSNDFETVLSHDSYTEKEYPEGANRARFMFLRAMSLLEMGERDQFMNSMKSIVENYPTSTVSELAGLYVKGLKDGRLLASGKFEMGSIWERKRGLGADEDSLWADSAFTDEKNVDFVFVVAYERDSVDENQLLYEMARYNFTNFTVRNFDISIERGDGIDMLQVRTFLNYDEAFIYLHRLYNNEEMVYKLEGLKSFVISESNLKLLMKGKSFADYFDFYDEHFDNLGHLNIDDSTLDEPTELPQPKEEEGFEEEESGYDDDFIF
ncbi:MAG: tetratricopeptide repeat protein [Bacteroides sp.]|nr:tetratricopeptide repeat protein [Roseburia sp.]MCM1347139.1 tetratricopeptide repeat protein [Bacteroides sp.]MCM1420617.1 tetratricopeptide repeat protein [Bacteroides sp.]